MTTEDQRAEAQRCALANFPPRIGGLIHRRIVALRIAAGPSERLNAELDALVTEVLNRPDGPSGAVQDLTAGAS